MDREKLTIRTSKKRMLRPVWIEHTTFRFYDEVDFSLTLSQLSYVRCLLKKIVLFDDGNAKYKRGRLMVLSS